MKYILYKVYGTTWNSILRSCVKNSPESPYMAACWWNVSIERQKKGAPKVKLVSRMIMPYLNNPVATSLQNKWDQRMNKLFCHELGHYNAGVYLKQKVEKYINENPSKSYEETAAFLDKQGVIIKKLEKQYNKNTEHGKTNFEFEPFHLC